MYKIRGVTLVELLTVISIIGVLTVVGIPAFKTMTSNRQADRLSQELQLDLAYARNAALTSAKTVKMKPKSSWSKGWEIKEGSTMLREKGANKDIANAGEISSSITEIQFDNRGQATVAGGSKFSVSVSGCSGNRKRDIHINSIGQLIVVNQSC
ncbi:MAG: hypothetical protein RL217_16 [Pseudomonadota bacterium]|jgi:prepilin-type N-terminal cleavage/methylation domain-containing protein